MITVDTLARGLGLELEYIAGESGGARPLTWAHVVDIPEPWKWIGRGELILTTGGGIPAPAEQAAWIDAVIASGAGGLLLAPRPGTEPLAPAALERADAAGFPILTASFDARFTAIAREIINASLERESRRLASAQRAFSLYSSSLVREESPGERLTGIARSLGLWFELVDAESGRRLLASRPGPTPGRDVPDRAGAQPPAAANPATALGSWGGPGPAPRLTIGSCAGGVPEPALRQGFASIVAIELSRGFAERRALMLAAGALAREWAAGRTDRSALAEVFPPAARQAAAQLRFAVVPGGAGRGDLRERLLRGSAWAEPRAAFAHGDHLVILGPASWDPVAELPGERFGLGPVIADHASGPADALRLALLAAERTSAERPVADEADVRLDNLVLPDTAARRAAIAETLLGPLRDHDTEHGTELLPTLRAFYAHERSPGAAARALGVHRHTLGNRLAAVERVTGLNPSATAAIARLWLALEAERLGDWPGLGAVSLP